MIIQEALLAILPYVEDPENTADAASRGMRHGDVYRHLSARLDDLPTRRSVRRVMNAMPDYVGHVGNTNAARWFKVRDTVTLSNDWRMNVDTAIALLALERIAGRQLPGAIMEALAPRFAQARATLDMNGSEHARKGKTWNAKIARIASARPLLLPAIDPDIYRRVTDALMRDRKIHLCYQPLKPGAKPKNYANLSPFGLIDDAGIFYLVAESQNGTRLFRLDRMQSVKVRDEPSVAMPASDLDAFLASSGIAGFKPEPPVLLELRVHAREGRHERSAFEHALNQFRLDESQHVVEWAEDGESFVIAAQVRPSVSLRNYLFSQSDTVEVLSPPSMRADFAERVERMAQRYRQATPEAASVQSAPTSIA